jgi:hypothetical protein
MVPLCNRLIVPETILVLPLVRGSLGLVNYPFRFFRQLAELQADLNQRVIITVQLIDDQLVFLFLYQASLEVFHGFPFCLLELKLPA